MRCCVPSPQSKSHQFLRPRAWKPNAVTLRSIVGLPADVPKNEIAKNNLCYYTFSHNKHPQHLYNIEEFPMSNFDHLPNRRNTGSEKWDKYKESDIIPLWVADMDFISPSRNKRGFN